MESRHVDSRHSAREVLAAVKADLDSRGPVRAIGRGVYDAICAELAKPEPVDKSANSLSAREVLAELVRLNGPQWRADWDAVWAAVDAELAKPEPVPVAWTSLSPQVQDVVQRRLGDMMDVATEVDGVVIGEHVAETLAEVAAKRIATLEAALREIKECRGPDAREAIADICLVALADTKGE